MGSQIIDVVVRILPIVLIIGLGNLIRARSILSAETVDEVKALVVNVALPAVLFVAFLEMELQAEFLGLFATILAVCLGMLALGYLLRRVLAPKNTYYPFLITGFEFGMIGVTLFGTAYGLENVGYIAIVDLSHELFIWFVLATLLTATRDGAGGLKQTLKGFVTSPLIIAILAALMLNLAGLKDWFAEFPLGVATLETLGFLGDLLIPVILIIIGYGMKLSWSGVRDAAAVVAIRLAILAPLAILVNTLIVRRLLGLPPAFEAAVFTFFILPPPYIVPLFMRRDQTDERVFANNVLSLYTLVSLAIFVVYFALNPTMS